LNAIDAIFLYEWHHKNTVYHINYNAQSFPFMFVSNKY